MTRYITLWLIFGYGTAAARAYCSYGESCWPSDQEWAAFNSSISGRLITPRPPAAVCHSGAYDATACSTAQQNWTVGHWRSDQPGGYQQTNWENGDAKCFIDSPQADACEQGRVPVLAVAAESVEDIQKAVDFGARKNLNMVVKNTGHDYLGRSSGVGSFSIWTHKMKGIEFSDSFRPASCSDSTQPTSAVTVKAGEQWLDVYRAAHGKGKVVVGGSARSVGASGGFATGGGHSPLSHLYGMAVDTIVQYTIVTADGKHIIANACTNQDLFWALRGGGGSTWGVLTSVTYKTFPAFKNFLYGIFYFTSNDTQATFEFNKLFYEFIPALVDAGFRGYPSIGSNFTAIGVFQANSSADPNSTGDFSAANSTFAPLFNLVASKPPGTVSLIHEWKMFPSFFEFFDPTIGDIAVGTNVLLGSRIIPRDVFLNKSTELTQLTMAMSQFGVASINLVGGGAVHNVKVGDTPLHPAWRVGGIASFNFGSSWPNGASPTVRQFFQTTVTNYTQALDALVGAGAGGYLNEADPMEPKWKEAWWGPNYGRLLDIKRKVDPNGVFTCNRCVGSDLPQTNTTGQSPTSAADRGMVPAFAKPLEIMIGTVGLVLLVQFM